MPHTNAWDDNLPLDTENAGLGASRIRLLKDNVQDRMKLGHTWGESTTYDGEHKEDKFVTASVTGTYNVDLSLGRIFFLTLTGNTTLSMYNTDGLSDSYTRSFILAFKQDATNVYSVIFPATFKFHNNTAIGVTTQASWVTMYQVINIGGVTDPHYMVIHIGDYQW